MFKLITILTLASLLVICTAIPCVQSAITSGQQAVVASIHAGNNNSNMSASPILEGNNVVNALYNWAASH